MKIVNILGGLGNQMFQYAFAVGLQAAFPKEVIKLNTLSFKGYPLHNGFELDSILRLYYHLQLLKIYERSLILGLIIVFGRLVQESYPFADV